jgi:ABC-type branched-subunit amino acid transport system ATPase component
MNDLLKVENVSRHFGGVKAISDVTLSVGAGQRVAIIGPNGAGKSTLANCIAGSTPVSSGSVVVNGASINRMSAQTRSRRGISRTFQNLELFVSMTVLENVLLAVDATAGWGSSLHPGRARVKRDRAMEALGTLGIADYADRATGTLPYGVRKLVELSRAFVTEPKLLLLDEPVAGLTDTEEFLDVLQQGLDRLECGVILIEHDMPTVRRLCEWVHVLDSGRLIASGTYDKVAKDPRVIEAYLGASATEGGSRS